MIIASYFWKNHLDLVFGKVAFLLFSRVTGGHYNILYMRLTTPELHFREKFPFGKSLQTDDGNIF